MTLRPSRLAALAATALAAACSVETDLSSTDAAIVAFHGQLDRAQFAQIYDATSPELKAVTNQTDWVNLLAAVHTKLGRFRTGRRVGWNDTRNTSGHYVSIGYQARYEKGPAMEEFLFRLEGARAVLAGYHVNAKALRTD